MRSFRAGVRIQLWLITRQPDNFLMLWTVPFTALIYISIIRHSGRDDLLPNALLAPVLIGLWMFSVNLASGIVEIDRWLGTLESAIASPGSLQGVILGRICTVTGCGVFPLLETWLLARLVFGITPQVHHPGVFLATMLATGLATAATSAALAAVFVLSRNSAIYTNFLTYPVYILSGLLVPISFLPGFLQPLSRLTFLYWCSDLLRSAMRAQPVTDVAGRLAVIVAFGVGTLAVGLVVMGAVLRRSRELGTLTYA